jgi:excisionase family DNA binding protein
MGVPPIWYERVSPRLLDIILGSLSGEEGGLESAVPALEDAALDGLPDGAVFTVEEAADILKVPSSTIQQMVLEKQIRSLRFGDETRIPRRALVACLRGMSAEEFDDFLEKRAGT